VGWADWGEVQVDLLLQLNGQFVAQCAEGNPFPPPEDAALTAAAPTEADHEASSVPGNSTTGGLGA